MLYDHTGSHKITPNFGDRVLVTGPCSLYDARRVGGFRFTEELEEF